MTIYRKVMKKEKVSVSELTSSISYLLSEGLGTVCVVGEISNFKEHTSGHRYFSLKDDYAQISAVMWKSRKLNFVPKDGMKIIARGAVSVYAPRGQYQLDCTSIEPLGKGDLFMAFEELKAKLEAKGYFDLENKQTIPDLSLKIGVLTSPTGAAVQDILTTIKRRMPAAEVYFRPALVQGDGSAEDIAKGIKELDKCGLDILICGRGGGSIEDLWSFNTEVVADAIFKCTTLIISAVGHETDFTIADFVADLRAATPTAAAEIATPITCQDLIADIDMNINNSKRAIKQRLDNMRSEIDSGVRAYGFRRINERINNEKQRIDEATMLISRIVNSQIKNHKSIIANAISMLKSLYPLQPLKKGFAIIKSDGAIINNSMSLVGLDKLELHRLNETAEFKIEQIAQNN